MSGYVRRCDYCGVELQGSDGVTRDNLDYCHAHDPGPSEQEAIDKTMKPAIKVNITVVFTVHVPSDTNIDDLCMDIPVDSNVVQVTDINGKEVDAYIPGYQTVDVQPWEPTSAADLTEESNAPESQQQYQPEKPCKRCGAALIESGVHSGKCPDETCPYSDRKQDESFTEG